jgi:catechol 2,3-dioxygenase-like lactoylglutathione lyase family enzyme
LASIDPATPHHVGCAVSTLAAGLSVYADGLGLVRRTAAIEVPSQQVRVCFLELAPGFFLELIAPTNDASQLTRYLRTGFYHLCFLVENLDAAAARLSKRRFVGMPPFASEAFANRRCQFFLSPLEHLVELCETTPADFERFLATRFLPEVEV